jgi:hypothetical protein
MRDAHREADCQAEHVLGGHRRRRGCEHDVAQDEGEDELGDRDAEPTVDDGPVGERVAVGTAERERLECREQEVGEARDEAAHQLRAHVGHGAADAEGAAPDSDGHRHCGVEVRAGHGAQRVDHRHERRGNGQHGCRIGGALHHVEADGEHEEKGADALGHALDPEPHIESLIKDHDRSLW